jgi:hypothetical protein
MNGMEIVLSQVIVFSFTGFATIGIIKAITGYRLRKRMIDAGLVDEKSMELLKEGSKENFYSSLKWGLILFFSGIGLMLIEFGKFYYESSMAFGIVITAASLGFLIYFMFMRRELNKDE